MKKIVSIENLEKSLSALPTAQATVATSAFIGVAASAFIASVPQLLFMLIPMLPVAGVALSTQNLFKTAKGRVINRSWLQGSYNRIFKKWLESYVNDSDSLSEKKYKLIFTSLWLDKANWDKSHLNIYIDQLINQWEKELGADTGLKISEMYHPYQSLDKSKKLVDLVLAFMQEDRLSEEKKSIAKNVYQDFSHSGLLSHYMLERSMSIVDMLAGFNSILSAEDLDFFKKNISPVKSELQNRIDMKYNPVRADSHKECLFNIINNNPQHISEIINFYQYVFPVFAQDENLLNLKSRHALHEKLENILPEKISVQKKQKI